MGRPAAVWPRLRSGAIQRRAWGRGETDFSPRWIAFASLVTLGFIGPIRPATAADISVTSGPTVVNSAADLGGNDVIVDNSTNQNATLQVNSPATLGNGITLNNGGTLDNAGTITRSGAGVTGDIGQILNRTGGTISSTGDNGIYFSLGGTVTNQVGATISGTTGIYSDWPSSQTATVTNSGTITGTAAPRATRAS